MRPSGSVTRVTASKSPSDSSRVLPESRFHTIKVEPQVNTSRFPSADNATSESRVTAARRMSSTLPVSMSRNAVALPG